MAQSLTSLRDRYVEPTPLASNPYPPGSEEWQFFQDSVKPSSKPAPASIWDLVKNTASGLATDVPKGFNWFLEQARRPDAEVQADARRGLGAVAKGIYDIPENFGHSIERYRAGSEFEPKPALDAAMLGTSGGLLGGTGGEAGMVLTAGQRRRVLPRPVWDETIPPPPAGHNMPPPEARLEPLAEVPAKVAAVPVEAPPPLQEKTWAQGLPRPKPATRSTEIPDIRSLPVDDAVAIARTQPHLIKAGDQSEGFYVGGPRDLVSKQDLNARRKAFDDYIAADPRGGDWYDRYRTGQTEITGGDPLRNEWSSKMHGQWSAGVDPGSELHFVTKERNAAIAGMPVKAARPAQHEAFMAALEANDPNLLQLGDKTGMYAQKVNPDQLLPPGATGVNDFRHTRNFGYTEVSGEPQKGALGPAGHKFMDMETALAVDRANRIKLDGRSDWTGEQLQAAPWVRQKALDIQERAGKNEDGSFKLSYEDAFKRANMTIADFLPRHTAYATFEAQPGSTTGHLPGSVKAPQSERIEYAADPASTWATAPGGRDAIYSGLGVPGTGNYMAVRPSQPMTGHYRTPEGVIENNPGEVARPLVTFNTPKTYDKSFIGPPENEPFKTLTGHDRALLEASEAFRGLIDAQNASAAHKNWTGGPLKEMNSLFIPRTGATPPAKMLALESKTTPYGASDVVDTGGGVTATNFNSGMSEAQGKDIGKAVKKGEFGEFGEPHRVRSEGIYIDYTDKWPKGVGSGEATRHMLGYVNRTPEIKAAFNNNPYLAERALAKLERDEAWASKWGAAREDVQNLRRIVGEGPGAIDRIEAALKKGAIALPAVAAMFASGTQELRELWGRE